MVIDEASGTIVMGANVRISTVAIAQGNLTIRVTETPEVSQPGAAVQRHHRPWSAHPDPDRRPARQEAGHPVGGGVTLRDLVASLNALGVGPRDLISILQSIKAAGALQADLEVR